MPLCHLNNRQLYYDLAGHGPAVALLHHATGSSRSWRRQLPVLAQHFQVLTIDRPGFGRSPDLAAWPMDYLRRDVDDLLALLDLLEIERAALVGHSDGATIALLAAALRPATVTKVVAEAPHVAVEIPRCPDAIRQAMERIAASPQLASALERDHPGRGRAVAQRWADQWLDPAFWSWDERAALAHVRCPVLVIHGAEDPFFSVGQSQLVADGVACGTLWVLPGVGHSPHTEADQLYTTRVVEFLAS
jgi:pimeloyl-ACP methyl ester carboxylesterase